MKPSTGGGRTKARGYEHFCLKWRLESAIIRQKPRTHSADKRPKASDHEATTEARMSVASLKVFPYDLDRAMSKAINCYIADLCPSFGRRPQYQRRGVDRLCIVDVVAFVIHNEVVFRCVIAYTRIIQEKMAPGFIEPSNEANSMLQQAFRAVSMALLRRDYLTLPDPVVWALLSLVGIFSVLEQYEQSDIHAEGLKHLIVTIGGFEALHRDGYTARTTKSFLNWNDATRKIRAEERAVQDNPGACSYLTYPFPPRSRVTMARLPMGFSCLAWSRTLNLRCIQTLESITAWNEQMQSQTSQNRLMLDEINQVNVVTCIWMLKSRSQSIAPLTWNERLSLLTSAGYCISVSGDLDSWFAANCFIQLYCRALQKVTVTGCDESLMLWAALVLKAVYGPENHSSVFSEALLRKIDQGAVDEVLKGLATEKLCNFFWNKDLSTALNQCQLSVVKN